MPRLTIYHLTFPHGLHIGRGGVESVEESLEYVPSDTLFAAMLDTWRHLGRDVSELLPKESEPAFRVTSAFPFAGGVRFYPRPMDLGELFSDVLIRQFGAGKNIKQIRYLSEDLLKRARTGEFLDDELSQDKEGEWACRFSLQGSALWLSEGEIERLPERILSYTEKVNGKKQRMQRPIEVIPRKKVFESQTAPRVTVDRISSASNLFQSERVIFNEGCGLWFGIAGQFDDFFDLLSALGDSGLGGERTAGYGHFDCNPQPDHSILLAESSASSYLLSRWHPRDQAESSLLQKGGSAYKLEAVEGWLRTPDPAAAQRRKRVWMVAEGSLIEGSPRGDAVKVTPEYEDQERPGRYIQTVPHEIYRPGFAVTLDWTRKVTHGEL